MKLFTKKNFALVITICALMALTVIPAAAITTSDTPIPGPEAPTYWGQEELMYEGEPAAASKWSNAFCNEQWTGALWTAAEVDGTPAIKITAVEGKNPMLDFNYYQYNNDKYYPSLVCADYPVVAFKFMYNEEGAAVARDVGSFWASVDADELGTTAEAASMQYMREAAYEANVWYTDIIDLSSFKFTDEKAWSDETIRQFRVYPFGEWIQANGDEECYVAWVGFFKSVEEAQAFAGTAAEETPVVETPVVEEVVETPVTETPAVEEVVETPVVVAPQTFDAVVIAAISAVVSLAGYAISKKR